MCIFTFGFHHPMDGCFSITGSKLPEIFTFLFCQILASSIFLQSFSKVIRSVGKENFFFWGDALRLIFVTLQNNNLMQK